MTKKIHDVVMIGAGPAALSAAIYTAREDIDTVLYEKGLIGGLAATTDWIDNYPGYMNGIEGLRLADELRGQAERFGAAFEFGDVTNIERQAGDLVLTVNDKKIPTRAVLIATGSNYKKLGVPGEDEYYSRGVHYCATCDGAFYVGKRLIVVGGGNSGVQEAMFLTRFADHIDLIVRSEMKASVVLQKKLQTMQDKITVHTHTTIESIDSVNDTVIGATVRDGKTGTTKRLHADGVFVFIGLLPNTKFLENTTIELDEVGLIKSDENLQTSMQGVFVAGDVRSHATMQIASAVGDGATAALKIREYLEKE